MTGQAKRRLRQEDWLAIGLAALAEQGPEALTIEALCQRADKTKGSFYAHFATISAFCGTLAEHWRQAGTEEIVETVEKNAAPGLKLDLLNMLATRLDPALEQGMRRLALREQAVRDIVAAVDRRRVAYLAHLYEASAGFPPETAKAVAQLEYAAFIGFQQTPWLASGPDEMRKAFERFTRLIGR